MLSYVQSPDDLYMTAVNESSTSDRSLVFVLYLLD